MSGDCRKLFNKALDSVVCVVYFLKLPIQILEVMCNTIYIKKNKKQNQCLLLGDATSP